METRSVKSILNIQDRVKQIVEAMGDTDVKKKKMINNVEDKNWSDCKEAVDKLPGDYDRILSTAKQKPFVSQSGKHTKSLLKQRLFGFEVELMVYQPISHGDTQAWYVAFNNQTNTCYKRSLTDL